MLEPPDPMPNSEVKRHIADGSVGSPHVRVGHRQALIPNPVVHCATGFFMVGQGPYTGDDLCGHTRYSGVGSRQALIPNPRVHRAFNLCRFADALP